MNTLLILIASQTTFDLLSTKDAAFNTALQSAENPPARKDLYSDYFDYGRFRVLQYLFWTHLRM